MARPAVTIRLSTVPDLRKDPLTGRWVIIATDRPGRPSDFTRETVTNQGIQFCPYCPGNEGRTPPEILAYRNHGAANEPGWTLRVTPSRFPVLRVEGSLTRKADGPYDRMTGVGAHEVFIDTPDHAETLARMPASRAADLLRAIRDRILDLRRDSRLKHAVVFKNYGESAGALLEHSHSQLIALPIIPKCAHEKLEGGRRYWDCHERCVFCDIISHEIEGGARLVAETEKFAVLTPYAARFPFETWILPKDHSSHFETLRDDRLPELAEVLQRTVLKLEVTLENPPYNLVVHSAPMQDGPVREYHWHIEIIPKLTHMAGFEWGSGFHINPTPPEEAAQYLREARV